MSELTLRRVGHKGADLIAPGNTRESFDAALAAEVDMIEFDVLPVRHGEPDGPLMLAHDYREARKRTPLSVDEGLAHLASAPFAHIGFDVDLKLPGYERGVVDALRRHGLVERSLVSSQYMSSLIEVRRLEPALRVGWTLPRASRDYTSSWKWALPAYAALQVLKAVSPWRAGRALRAGRADAIMANWRLVTPRLARAVRAAGGELYVWTVDELPRIRSLAALGVTGVITNDPRLFAQLEVEPAT